MAFADANEISEVVFNFITTQQNPALFAGAGVGVKAGLPTWERFMEHLARVADQYDSTTAELIRKRTISGYYLNAAEVYKTCPEIPPGEMYKAIASPFLSPDSSDKLAALVALPFTSIFTTNYDRALHNAYAQVHEKSPLTVELSDPSMKRAPFLTEFYIARLHGRAELAETVVFCQDDYRKLEGDNDYNDFVRHILTRFSCLFIGFSFEDPAINQIFTIIEKRLAPTMPQLHLAILPADTTQTLKKRLAQFNIRTVQYYTEDEHAALWKGISLAARKLSTTQKAKKSTPTFSPSAIKQFLAASYSRVRILQEEELTPLLDSAVDGIILGLLKENSNGMDFDDVISQLRKYLPLYESSAKQLATTHLQHLAQRGWCNISNNHVRLIRQTSKTLTKDINALVQGVVNRMIVRERESVTPQMEQTISQCLEDVLLVRSWDLGAHYANAQSREIPAIFSTISSAIEERYGGTFSPQYREKLARSCYNLFKNPNREESFILAELGRIAFALQLVLNSPCSSLAYQDVLPQHVYLDASVLMPAIVEGHPYRPTYIDAMQRLDQAARNSNIPLRVLVAEGFLNEIINHRQNARREVDQLHLEEPENLEQHILYYGAENTNIFIGAYGSWVDRLVKSKDEAISFEEFLQQVAPYRNESELSNYLANQGIMTIKIAFTSDEKLFYSIVKDSLFEAYETDDRWVFNTKPTILIVHEAEQLAKLGLELKQGIKSIFVTADNRLRRLTAELNTEDKITRQLGQIISSHRGLVQLVDLLVGVQSDPVSLTRLFWGGGFDDESTILWNYYTHRALQHYNDAMAMTLPEVLRTFVPAMVQEAHKENIQLFSSNTPESKSHTARFLDRLEDRFYENMADVILEQNPEEYNTVIAIRKDHLTNHIKQTLELIKEYEDKERESDTEAEKKKCQSEISQLQVYLANYQQQLDNLTKLNS